MNANYYKLFDYNVHYRYVRLDWIVSLSLIQLSLSNNFEFERIIMDIRIPELWLENVNKCQKLKQEKAKENGISLPYAP